MLVLVAPAGCAALGQIALGRVLVRQWLRPSGHGYATHPLSQIIDSPHTRSGLAGVLGIDEQDRLLNVIRVGRPLTPMARSAPRVA